MRSSFIDYQSPFPPPDAKPKPKPRPKPRPKPGPSGPVTTMAVGEEQGAHVLPLDRGEDR